MNVQEAAVMSGPSGFYSIAATPMFAGGAVA